MDEPALALDPASLSPQKEMVRVFYKEMWDHADKSLIPQIFHEDFTFRGSLGPVLVGYDQFAGYVDLVTAALGNYTSDVLTLVEEGDQVSGRLRFHGIHRRPLFGIEPTAIRMAVTRLVKDGLLQSVDRGTYATGEKATALTAEISDWRSERSASGPSTMASTAGATG